MNAALHLFGYLKRKHNATLAFVPTYPSIDEAQFPDADWKRYYGNVKEKELLDKPQPRGKEVIMRCFVDADYAGDLMTRRSRTGFLIYLNVAPILWYTKQ